MSAGRYMEGDLLERPAHHLGVAFGHDDVSGLAFIGVDRAEDPCREVALILGGRGRDGAAGPTQGDLGLLAAGASSCYHNSIGVPCSSSRMICARWAAELF